MGTGPWPQPPTEAEQLQALMAAANGESYTFSSSSFYLLSIHPFPNEFLSFHKLSESVHGQGWFIQVPVWLKGN